MARPSEDHSQRLPFRHRGALCEPHAHLCARAGDPGNGHGIAIDRHIATVCLLPLGDLEDELLRLPGLVPRVTPSRAPAVARDRAVVDQALRALKKKMKEKRKCPKRTTPNM